MAGQNIFKASHFYLDYGLIAVEKFHRNYELS